MKFPFSSRLRLLPITPRMLRSGVRRLRSSCWALCAVFCLLFSGVSKGATQEEIQAAITAALADYGANGDNALFTIPVDSEQYNAYIADLLRRENSGSVADFTYQIAVLLNSGLFGSGSVETRQPFLSLILTALQAQASGDTNLVEFLRPFLSTITEQGNALENGVYDISETVSSYGSLWDGIRDSDRWRVHDSELQTALVDVLSSNGSEVTGISGNVGSIAESVSGLSEYLSSINSQLDGFPRDWLTKSQLEQVIENADEPPHDEPSDDSAEKAQAEQSAEYEWKQAESISYSNRWELAEWKYTEMLPGNASIVSENPSDNPGGTGFSPDDSGLPLFSRLVVAQEFGMSIDSSVIEPGDYPVFMSYYNEFRVRWARIFHAVWDFIGAFLIFFIARREWKYYMGVGDNSPEVESDVGGIF